VIEAEGGYVGSNVDYSARSSDTLRRRCRVRARLRGSPRLESIRCDHCLKTFPGEGFVGEFQQMSSIIREDCHHSGMGFPTSGSSFTLQLSADIETLHHYSFTNSSDGRGIP
jgi:hypothetical protein